MKYLIVDGYALAHRAWHAYPELTNNAGRDTRVTVGFFKQLLSKVKELSQYQVIFVFDSPGGNFRKDLDSTYKATRTPNPQTFYNQVDEIVELCKLIAPTYQVPGYEADDLAGSFVAQYVGEGDTALLLTVDGDWLQLLRAGVEVLQLKTTGSPVHWTRDTFFEQYSGLMPAQLIDYKAICGDGSDNIPGIKGIGWVTANALLKEYRTVEHIYEEILKIPNKGNVQKKLIDNKERVFLNKQLATIKTDVPLSNPEDSVVDFDRYLDYLMDELNADSLANLMGVYLNRCREVVHDHI